MGLESLANELLLDAFEFLSASDLIRAFYGLNYRFNSLVYRHFCTHGFNFRSVSKNDFDIISRQCLPSVVNQIPSLCFSNDYDTPGQINQFSARGFTLRQFTHLRILKLCHLSAKQIMNEITLSLHHLHNLTRLTLEHCHLADNSEDALSLMNSIWSLPKLTHCYFNKSVLHMDDRDIFVLPTVTSSSIKYLSMSDIDDRESEMTPLFQHTPHIQRLSVSIWTYCPNFTLSSPVPSITTLKLLRVSYTMMANLVQWMPNLVQLQVIIGGYVDGNQWEQLIRDHLPQLKLLQFDTYFTILGDDNSEDEMNEKLESFRSSFWVVEHQWFVQCDRRLKNGFTHLHTLPYAFEKFNFYYPSKSISTYPFANYHWSYDRVRTLDYQSHISEGSASSHIEFSNIEHLSVELPISDHFWSTVLKFDRLLSLEVSSYVSNENCSTQLQTLLDRAPRLSVLRIRRQSAKTLSKPVFESKSFSIYYLNLISYNEWYNDQQCATLTQSPLGIQCKILSIAVEDRPCILSLVNKMSNLQALTVQCRDDPWTKQSTSTEDELVEWLREHLTFKCPITKITRLDYVIQLWLR